MATGADSIRRYAYDPSSRNLTAHRVQSRLGPAGDIAAHDTNCVTQCTDARSHKDLTCKTIRCVVVVGYIGIQSRQCHQLRVIRAPVSTDEFPQLRGDAQAQLSVLLAAEPSPATKRHKVCGESIRAYGSTVMQLWPLAVDRCRQLGKARYPQRQPTVSAELLSPTRTDRGSASSASGSLIAELDVAAILHGFEDETCQYFVNQLNNTMPQRDHTAHRPLLAAATASMMSLPQELQDPWGSAALLQPSSSVAHKRKRSDQNGQMQRQSSAPKPKSTASQASIERQESPTYSLAHHPGTFESWRRPDSAKPTSTSRADDADHVRRKAIFFLFWWALYPDAHMPSRLHKSYMAACCGCTIADVSMWFRNHNRRARIRSGHPKPEL